MSLSLLPPGAPSLADTSSSLPSLILALPGPASRPGAALPTSWASLSGLVQPAAQTWVHK